MELVGMSMELIGKFFSGLWSIIRWILIVILKLAEFALSVLQVLWVLCCSVLKIMLLIMSGGRSTNY